MVNDLFQVTAGDSHQKLAPEAGALASQPLGVPWHLCKPSLGLFRTPHPAPAAPHLQAPHPTRGLRPQSWPERAGRRPQASAPGHGNQGAAAPGRPKVMEEGSRRRDGTHYKEPSWARAGDPPGRSRAENRKGRPARSTPQPARLSPLHTAPQRPARAVRAAPGLVGLRVLRCHRPPATTRAGTTTPRKPCAPDGSWEMWSRARRGRARRGARELRVPGRSAAGAGTGGLNGGSPAPRQGCVGCGGCGRRRRPGPACGPGG